MRVLTYTQTSCSKEKQNNMKKSRSEIYDILWKHQPLFTSYLITIIQFFLFSHPAFDFKRVCTISISWLAYPDWVSFSWLAYRDWVL